MAREAVEAALAQARAEDDPHAVAVLERALAELDGPTNNKGGAARTPFCALSTRELEVVRLLVTGKSDKEIAEVLVISPRTVQSHVASALRKTGTNRRTELMALAMSSGAFD